MLEAEHGLDIARHAAFVAGHSLGEYSALAAAGAFSLADTARLLQAARPGHAGGGAGGRGAMAALLGLDIDGAAAVAEEAAPGRGRARSPTTIAPGQVVISGHKAAVERAVRDWPRRKGAKRADAAARSPRPSIAPLMQPAADAMAEALAEVRPCARRVPLVANVAGRADQRSGRDPHALWSSR